MIIKSTGTDAYSQNPAYIDFQPRWIKKKLSLLILGVPNLALNKFLKMYKQN